MFPTSEIAHHTILLYHNHIVIQKSLPFTQTCGFLIQNSGYIRQNILGKDLFIANCHIPVSLIAMLDLEANIIEIVL